jgi:hypothetical protein
MESLGLILYKDGDQYLTKNKNYVKDNSGGPEFYKSHEGIEFVRQGDVIALDDGTMIGIGNFSAAEKDKYSLSSYPYLQGKLWNENQKKQWIQLFEKEVSARLYRPKKPDDRYIFVVLDPNYKTILSQMVNKSPKF